MKRGFIAVGKPDTAYIAKAHIVSVAPRGDGVVIDLVNGKFVEATSYRPVGVALSPRLH
jgi:hypothetical protein